MYSFKPYCWVVFRKSDASPEDIEYFECQSELMDDLYLQHQQVERIISELSTYNIMKLYKPHILQELERIAENANAISRCTRFRCGIDVVKDGGRLCFYSPEATSAYCSDDLSQ